MEDVDDGAGGRDFVGVSLRPVGSTERELEPVNTDAVSVCGAVVAVSPEDEGLVAEEPARLISAMYLFAVAAMESSTVLPYAVIESAVVRL